MDFSRAFDRFNHHNILMEKLKLYGHDQTPQNFVKSYMSCYKQTPIVNGHNSAELPVTYGTLQGSILDPLIFILYVNDIFKFIEKDNFFFFFSFLRLL